jgi:hypothetical protein
MPTDEPMVIATKAKDTDTCAESGPLRRRLSAPAVKGGHGIVTDIWN